MNRPTRRKGIPRPREYDKSKKNALVGCVIAKVKIAPRIAPTQGVQPTAKAAPKTKEVR